ncbi:MAG: isopentenyl phosphate kinase [Anaerolineae bacterium]|jgi:isopentenyl phosphate kinase
MSELAFVKLGGSVITDKTRAETARPEVIRRLAREIASAMAADPGLGLVLGHGSGSFGHIAAQRHGTRGGVCGTDSWRGFAEVATIAARLNRTVVDAFHDAGIPVWSLQPSASAHCDGGELESMALEPVTKALKHGLVPVLYGDVALDASQGGTIISTEQIFVYLARHLEPDRIILVGTVDGVFDGDPIRDPSARQIPEISAANWASVEALLGGSHGTDVTGGMLAKVAEMVDLVRQSPGLEVQVISGEQDGALRTALERSSEDRAGTVIRW